LVTKVLGDRTGVVGCSQTNHRRTISGRCDHDCTLTPFLAEGLGHEVEYFTTPLADHADDYDVCGRV